MSGHNFEMDANKMSINNIISRWYSRPDAKFKTRVPEMHEFKSPQLKGYCIESKKYKMIGLIVDYIIKKGSISKVIDGPGFGVLSINSDKDGLVFSLDIMILNWIRDLVYRWYTIT